MGSNGVTDFQQAHRQWVTEALSRESVVREENWSEAIAVGNLNFVEKVKSELGSKAAHHDVTQLERTYVLREDGEDEPLSLENTRFWNEFSQNYGNLASSDPRFPIARRAP